MCLPALNYYQQICSPCVRVCVPSIDPPTHSLSCSLLSLVVLLFYRSPFQFLSLCPHVTAVQIFSKTKLIPIFVFVENFGVANITTTATTTMPGRRWRRPQQQQQQRWLCPNSVRTISVPKSAAAAPPAWSPLPPLAPALPGPPPPASLYAYAIYACRPLGTITEPALCMPVSCIYIHTHTGTHTRIRGHTRIQRHIRAESF